MPNQSPMPAELFHCQINYQWIPNYFIAKSIIYEFLIISLPNPLKEMIVYKNENDKIVLWNVREGITANDILKAIDIIRKYIILLMLSILIYIFSF